MRQVDELVLEELHRPEIGRRVLQVGALPATHLVVQHTAAAEPREVGDRLRIVMRAAWATVADHYGGRPRVEVTDDSVPRLVAVTGQRPLGHVPAPFASSGWWQAA